MVRTDKPAGERAAELTFHVPRCHPTIPMACHSRPWSCSARALLCDRRAAPPQTLPSTSTLVGQGMWWAWGGMRSGYAEWIGVIPPPRAGVMKQDPPHECSTTGRSTSTPNIDQLQLCKTAQPALQFMAISSSRQGSTVMHTAVITSALCQYAVQQQHAAREWLAGSREHGGPGQHGRRSSRCQAGRVSSPGAVDTNSKWMGRELGAADREPGAVDGELGAVDGELGAAAGSGGQQVGGRCTLHIPYFFMIFEAYFVIIIADNINEG
ncbi:hypothetical protein B0H14DRAFT_2618230 [Mycena olivaceomarginata]|nr:hypothetical protein B0H14DRAFT_2618230 [Mycena olivaceomarginata]